MITHDKPQHRDIKIGLGHIVADKHGWMLPGGKFTTNRAVATPPPKACTASWLKDKDVT